MQLKPTRRAVMAGLAGSALVGPSTLAQGTLQLPKSPVSLNFVDVAGNLALTQAALENYRKAKPQLVSSMTFTKAPAPELPGKIKAQQDAGRVDIDGVLTGIDALSAGVDQKLWVPLLPEYAASLPKLDDIYQPGAKAMQGLARIRAFASCSVRRVRSSNTCRIASRRSRRPPRSSSPGRRRTPIGSCMRGPRIPVPAASS
jgi:putative spermidine/putrescine transport system substrate-binding protein